LINTQDRDKIPKQTLLSLLKFFGDRLHDFECIEEILTCLKTILATWKSDLDEGQIAFVITQYVSCDEKMTHIIEYLQMSLFHPYYNH
jgi:hypothetical protein